MCPRLSLVIMLPLAHCSPSEAAEAALAGPGRVLIDGLTLGRGRRYPGQTGPSLHTGHQGVTRRNGSENSKGYV